jgi:hypothetical protein
MAAQWQLTGRDSLYEPHTQVPEKNQHATTVLLIYQPKKALDAINVEGSCVSLIKR